MKKAGRIVSYLLVLALVTTLLSGLGYTKADAVDVKAAGGTFTVVEIVPVSNMSTFGYFVKSWTDANYATRVSSITGNTTKFGNFNNYLSNAGCGTFNSTTNKFDSEDLFRKTVFGASDTRTINVIVKTPADSDLISTVNSADFIVINQSVPSALRIGDQKTFNDSGCQLSNDQVMAIFKKIAGVEGKTPVPYIIDFSLMGRESLDDVRDHNAAFNGFSNKNGALFGYLSADKLYNGDQGIGVGQGVAMKYGTDDHLYYGTDSTSYKLYKLLSAIDPSTLYGIYFQETDGSYGVDKNLSQIVNGPDNKDSGSDGEASLYCLNTKLSYWSDLAFRPYYLTTGNRDISTIMSTMGWTEDVTSDNATTTLRNKTVSDFCKKVGGGDGRGLVFSSKKGLFSIIKGSAGAGGLEWEDVSSSEVVVTSNDQGNKDGNTYKNVKLNLDKKNDGSYANWKVTFTLDGVTGVTNGGTINGKKITFQGTNLNKGNNEKMFDLTVSGSVSKEAIKTAIESTAVVEVAAAPGAGGSSNNNEKLQKVIAKTISIDYHPYRILMISDNTPDLYANRTVVADLVAAANEAGKSLAGGIVVDCVSKPQFDNISVNLDQTYDMICKVGGDSVVGSIGATKLSGYHGKVLSLNSGDSSSISTIKSNFKNDVLGKKFGVDFITVPTLYFTNFVAFFNGENGWGSYMGNGTTTVDGNKNYINDNNNSGKRYLDFKFKVSGASSYTADLYVDVDGDFKYEEDEKVSLDIDNSNNNENSIPLWHANFFGEGGKDYVGGFSWKIVIKSGSNYVSKIGYSAIRNETTNKNVIKILQVYPTDYTSEFDTEKRPHPMLLLPTKAEITAAKNNSSKGAISSYNINSLSGTKGVNELKNYFSGVIKIDRASGYDTDTGHVSGVTTGQDIPNSGKEASVIYNSSFLYYFLDQLQDYDIDVVRYSVNGFNSAVADKHVLLDTETGRLALAGGTGGQETNLNGSLKYAYTAAQLGYDDNSWKSETVSWTEGVFKKYLVVDGTEKIYGERGTADGSVTYYGATHGTATGEGVFKVDKENEFDLLMIGFGDSLDYMTPAAVGLLKNYLNAGGPAFVGNGAVSTAGACNTFGNDTEIRNILGISYSDTTGYNYQANAVHPLIVTNDTIFSHYPYTINRSMKASGDGKQPYKLTLSGSVNDPIVAFGKYSSSTNGYKKWADPYDNYYVYKKNNIVFCGFGNTFNDADMKQQGAVLPMAETLMIVNALVASSRFGSSPIHNDPYINCVDDDCSVLDVTGLEDDQIEKNTAGDTIWYFKDSVYTDYDAYDIADFMKPTNTETTFNRPVANSGLGIPGVTVTETGWTSNIRWIPYEAQLPTEAGGYMEFTTVAGTRLNLKVWSVADGDWVTPEDGKYHVSRNGNYYIGVPLDGTHSAYSGASGVKLGFLIHKTDSNKSIDMFALRLNLYKADKTNMLERHTLTMIRRVLYHVK